MQRSCGRSKASCTGGTGRLRWGHGEVMKVKVVGSHGPQGVREPAAESCMLGVLSRRGVTPRETSSRTGRDSGDANCTQAAQKDGSPYPLPMTTCPQDAGWQGDLCAWLRVQVRAPCLPQHAEHEACMH